MQSAPFPLSRDGGLSNHGVFVFRPVQVAFPALGARAAPRPEMLAEVPVSLGSDLASTQIAHAVSAHARQLVAAARLDEAEITAWASPFNRAGHGALDVLAEGKTGGLVTDVDAVGGEGKVTF